MIKSQIRWAGLVGLLGVVLLLAGCGPKAPSPEELIPPDGKYDVRILRDEWGVPHLYGKTDVDAIYGLAYANCEDDFETIQQGLFLARAKLASIQGKEGAQFDYLVKLFRFQEIIDEKYGDVPADIRALCDAYADGYNHYAALHPEEVLPGVLPARGKDIIAGFVIKSPLFFGMDNEVKRLFKDTRQRKLSQKVAAGSAYFTKGQPIGSNTFSIAPSRTPDGKTHLLINSHQPWTGPVAWYEAHLKSEEGLDIVGGVFPGAPVILHGHNRDLGWAHTVNSPDLVDIYVLDINPDNPDQYRFDGEWRDLEVSEVGIKVKLWGAIKWTFKQEALYSVHGPVVRRPHGTYAIRYAGYGDMGQMEQWFRMGKARNIDEFEAALKIRGIPSFNVGYADKAGNIWYVYNALLPIRAEGYNWKQYLPGDTSETLWTEYLPFEKLPQVRNPASGFVQSCNSTPYRTTIGPENPRPEDFSKTLGIEPLEDMKNRSLRALELLGGDDSITEEEFYAYKYDMKYSKESEAAILLKEILEMPPPEDPVVKKALEILAGWDLSADAENPATALAILCMEPIVRARMFGNKEQDIIPLFKEKAQLLQDTFGRIDVPWMDVNRIVRGTVNMGMGGGPDALHAVYGNWKEDHLEGVAGDCFVLLVTWDPDGTVRSRGIHQFGSATMDASSPHYADQVPLFAAKQTRPILLDEADLRQHLEAEYRPGEARPPQRAGTLAGS